MVKELADENTGSVKFGKVDISTSMQTAMAYGVMGVPMMLVFKDGQPHGGVLRGPQGKDKMQEFIDAAKG